jgi:hypothetical protein
MAVGRLGGSPVPLECYRWAEDPTIFGAAQTTIEPDVTLEIGDDGTPRAYLPSSLRFKDGGLFRPVAPFFELWAGYRPSDKEERQDGPLTLELLRQAGTGPDGLAFFVRAANRKAARRTGDPSCAYEAQVRVVGTDHARHPLLAASLRMPVGSPLVDPTRQIPLGSFQVVRAVPWQEMGVDLSIVRVRFTPARGEVYGPPTAETGPAPGTGHVHTIVAPANRILNADSAWPKYDADYTKFHNPEPSDTYDGADVNQDPSAHNQSWGVVDDTCDAVIQADLVSDGLDFRAFARVFVGPPDFAPDRRPFLSLADDLADRDPPTFADPESLADAEARVNDLFQRALETASLLNLDATRSRALGDNSGGTPQPDFPGLPKTDARSMSPGDVPYADLSNIDLKSVPHDWLPRTDLIVRAHGQLADLDSMVAILTEKADRVRMMIRPPYGRFSELPEDPAAPNARFRDPRVARDQMHDMRMPPYMRDNDASALSLTRRQYADIMSLIDRLVTARKAVMAAVAPGRTPPVPTDTPIRRRVTAVLNEMRRTAGS